MPFQFPWIARSSHNELVAELRREIADRKEEARKIMDLLTQRATGQKVFYPDPEPEPEQRPAEDLSGLEPMQRAHRVLGAKASLREKLKFVEKESTEQFLKSRSFTNTRTEIPAEMQNAMDEGRAASKGTN